jgi:hypothetical protein
MKKEKKISNLKCNKVSVLIILVFIPQPSVLEMVSQKLFYHCFIKGKPKLIKQNKTAQNNNKKPHKVSQVQMQYSFSTFFSMQV